MSLAEKYGERRMRKKLKRENRFIYKSKYSTLDYSDMSKEDFDKIRKKVIHSASSRLGIGFVLSILCIVFILYLLSI